MAKFAVIHNLDNLTEEQRKQYLRDVSTFLGLDPDMNLLDTLWMNNDDGLRKLTAYARRGTTDILRGIHKVSVKSLEQHDGPGYVSFKATGTQPDGRQEIAVGAHATEGLKGDRLASAVATSQTRALRRLTLQFVGGGILDESEVSSTTSIASQSTPLSQLALAPVPTVVPSSQPGKDITMIGPSQDPKTQVQVAAVIAVRDMQKTQQNFEEQQAKLRAEAINTLNQIPPKEGVSVQEIAPKPRKPRGRPRKVDLGPSEMPPVQVVEKSPLAPETVLTGTIIPVKETVTVPLPAVNGPHELGRTIEVPIQNFTLPVPVATKPKLSMEQGKPFRQRLFKVMAELEANGLISRENMGKSDQMRALANIMFEITNMNELDEKQWEKYLSTLENKIQTEGAKATVKYIEESIGI